MQSAVESNRCFSFLPCAINGGGIAASYLQHVDGTFGFCVEDILFRKTL